MAIRHVHTAAQLDALDDVLKHLKAQLAAAHERVAGYERHVAEAVPADKAQQLHDRYVHWTLSGVSKKGFLIKRGHRRKNWTERYVVLLDDRLVYAKDRNYEATMRGEVNLKRSVVSVAKEFRERPHTLRLEIPASAEVPERYELLIDCRSADEMRSWIDALVRVQRRLILEDLRKDGTCLLSVPEVTRMYMVYRNVCGSGTVPMDKDSFLLALRRLDDFGLARLRDHHLGSRVFNLIDTSGRRSINLMDFLVAMGPICKGSPETRLRVTFMAYDLDGNGYISSSELARMFKREYAAAIAHTVSKYADGDTGVETSVMSALDANGRPDFDVVVAETLGLLDQDNDGRISFDELAKWARLFDHLQQLFTIFM